LHIRLEIYPQIKIVVSKNVCFFNGCTYKFNNGSPMGAPFSSLIVDIFVSALERHIRNISPDMDNVVFWARSVDEVLCIYNCSDTSLNSSQFTLEIGDDRINFLDLSISFRPFPL